MARILIDFPKADNMENLTEINSLIKEKERIEGMIKYLPTITAGERVVISGSDGRYTFRTISDIIGSKKLDSLIEQFEALINLELLKAKEKNEMELSKYRIQKSA